MAKTPSTLQGKVAVITGGARGIGKATAYALAREGVKVAIADLDAELVARAASEVGGGAVGLPLDVTDHAAFALFLDDVEQRFGAIDIMINNAGVMPVGPFEDEKDSTAERVIEINFHAVLWGSKEALRRFRRRGADGHIINVASGAGWLAGGGGVTYTGVKFAVVGFSQALSLELHGSGVDVSVVAPAVVNTELVAGLADVKGLRRVTPEQVAAAIVKGLKRPRFVIWVPRAMGVMALTMSALPYGLRNSLSRLLNVDKLLLSANMEARAAYEARIAAPPTVSAPAAAEKPASPVPAEKKLRPPGGTDGRST